MFASVHADNTNRKLVGVVTKDGTLIMKSRTYKNYDSGYPCHVVREEIGLTRGTLSYWVKQEDSTPVYEGDIVTLQF